MNVHELRRWREEEGVITVTAIAFSCVFGGRRLLPAGCTRPAAEAENQFLSVMSTTHILHPESCLEEGDREGTSGTRGCFHVSWLRRHLAQPDGEKMQPSVSV